MKAQRLLRGHFFREGHGWYGAQIAAALVLAWTVSTGLGLTEAHWAVMSALSVSRADATATLAAGWQRCAATLGGALLGWAGAALIPIGLLPPPVLILAVVAAVAFVTADRVGLRSASIATLIVMTAASGAKAPVVVAGLRTLEIGIGAAAAMACAWLALRGSMTVRPSILVSGLLRTLAAQVSTASRGDASARESQAATVRSVLRRLGEITHGAPPESPQRKQFLLATRLAQDASGVLRQMQPLARTDAAQAGLAAAAICTALGAVAERLEEGPPATPALGALSALSAMRGEPWEMDVLQTLHDDLRKMLHLA